MRAKQVSWKQYEVDNFAFVAEDESTETIQCGAWALHVLTKREYKEIEKICKNGHWSNRIMFSYLRKHGYEIIPLGIGNLVEAWTTDGKSARPKLGPKNVLLIEQHINKTENTWSVVYKNHIAHSNDLDPLNPMEFINYPIARAYMIWHKRWRKPKSIF